jgi:phasin
MVRIDEWRRVRAPSARHEGSTDMAEATQAQRPKTKPAAPYVAEAPRSEAPGFDLPKFEIPAFEVPAAFREFAEKGVSQAKANWDKVKAATEETTGLLEDSYSTASKGAADYGLKLIEIGRANTNAAFDFAGQLVNVKSLSEVVELSTSYARKQFDAMTAQSKELTALAQKVATETVEPIKEA